MVTKQTSNPAPHNSTRNPNNLRMPIGLATVAALGSIIFGRTLEDHVDRTSLKRTVAAEVTDGRDAKEIGPAVEDALFAGKLAPSSEVDPDHKFELTPIQPGEVGSLVVDLDHSRGTSVGQSQPHPPTAKL